MKLKIRYCPCCAELVHFEPEFPVQRCWNCGCVSDFDLVVAPEVWFARHVWGRIEGATRFILRPLVPIGEAFAWMWPSPGRIGSSGKWFLVATIPAVVVMLLVANSFSPYIVHDPTAPFTLPGFPFYSGSGIGLPFEFTL